MAKSNKARASSAKAAGDREKGVDTGTAISANVQLPAGFKVKRQITVPSLVLKEVGKPRILRIEDAMRESTYVDPDPKKAKEKPATICAVTDMETGAVFQLLVPSVMKANLERDYADGAYVGKTFRVENLGKRPNKRYFDFSIFEVEAA